MNVFRLLQDLGRATLDFLTDEYNRVAIFCALGYGFAAFLFTLAITLAQGGNQ